MASTATAPPTCSPVPTPGALRSSSVHRSPLAPPAPWSTVVKEDVVSGPPPSKPRDREARPVHRRTCWCRDSGVPDSIWDEQNRPHVCAAIGDWRLFRLCFCVSLRAAHQRSSLIEHCPPQNNVPARPKQCFGTCRMQRHFFKIAVSCDLDARGRSWALDHRVHVHTAAAISTLAERRPPPLQGHTFRMRCRAMCKCEARGTSSTPSGLFQDAVSRVRPPQATASLEDRGRSPPGTGPPPEKV